MNIEFEYNQGCNKHINQDVYGYNKNFLWVIDGATEVFSNNYLSKLGDVYWLVNHINKSLMEQDTSLNLQDYVYFAIKKVYDLAMQLAPEITDIPTNKLPTYSICCVRYANNFIEYLCLGDCSLYVSNSPELRFTDERILPFHLQVNKVKEYYSHNVELYKKEVLKKVREIKQYINKENGYWIGTLDPEIINHAIKGKVKINPSESFLICSDGFRPSIDEAQLVYFNPKDIFDSEKLKEIIQKQIITEKKYLEETEIDISDDKTVLLVRI